MSSDSEQKPKPNELIPPTSVAYDIPIENINLEVPEGENVASSWEVWIADGDEYQAPQFSGIELGGKRVQGILSENRYDVAFFQETKADPGLMVTFTMQFQVEPGEGHGDLQRPPGLVVGVGIDPFGHTDPRGETVQWALRDLPYSQLVEASVTAEAKEGPLTVFVRNIAFIPGSGTAATGGTSAVCRYTCARLAYQRTYLLLPENTNEATWLNAARAARLKNWTVGGSADDAGLASTILGRPNTRVVAVDPQSWNPDLTAQWFDTNYSPGVTFISKSSAELNGNPQGFAAAIP